MSNASIVLPEPTLDERKNAMLAHVLQILAGPIPALIIFLVKRESKFVRFHALQPLIWQSVIIVFSMIAIAGFLVTLPFVRRSPLELPINFYIFFGGLYLLSAIHWIISLYVAISFGIRSYKGSWVRYPVIGNLATAWSGI